MHYKRKAESFTFGFFIKITRYAKRLNYSKLKLLVIFIIHIRSSVRPYGHQHVAAFGNKNEIKITHKFVIFSVA